MEVHLWFKKVLWKKLSYSSIGSLVSKQIPDRFPELFVYHPNFSWPPFPQALIISSIHWDHYVLIMFTLCDQENSSSLQVGVVLWHICYPFFFRDHSSTLPFNFWKQLFHIFGYLLHISFFFFLSCRRAGLEAVNTIWAWVTALKSFFESSPKFTTNPKIHVFKTT